MNVRRTKLLLRATTLALVAAGVAAVVAATAWPLRESGSATGRDESSGPARPSVGAADAVSMASLSPAWTRDLRRPLTGVSEPVVSTGPAANGLAVRLVGTIVDPARPRGIFVTVLGQMELRGVGETIGGAGGAEVLRVDERSATLSVAGRPVTLAVEKLDAPPIPPAVPSPPSARTDSIPPAAGEAELR